MNVLVGVAEALTVRISAVGVVAVPSAPPKVPVCLVPVLVVSVRFGGATSFVIVVVADETKGASELAAVKVKFCPSARLEAFTLTLHVVWLARIVTLPVAVPELTVIVCSWLTAGLVPRKVTAVTFPE
ncbi:MAG: hypothetical protein EOL91_08960 [Actinobacteria bacterium]|nr:hypothetical protein [Actinomycetota bacterium]